MWHVAKYCSCCWRPAGVMPHSYWLQTPQDLMSRQPRHVHIIIKLAHMIHHCLVGPHLLTTPQFGRLLHQSQQASVAHYIAFFLLTLLA